MPDASENVTITVNGREVVASKDQLVIDAAERNGVYIPRFCYHPRMRPVGMCRMCIVDIDTGRGPTLQPACMLPVAEGMVVETESPATKKAQDGVLEFLLINHPLDCPVCDKGGECPLQDQAYAYGPGESRFVEEKRHFEKPIPISDLVYLDRERCILCDRCTRFASEVAGDPLIEFIGRGSQTEVNTFPDDPFASYFSGNTVQICPVGALTAKPFRFKARPWDLAQVESTCTHCSVGCRIVIQSSRNSVLRYAGVDIEPVNWGWLCDKGRFGFEAVHHDDRLSEPLVRKDGELVSVGWSDALTAASNALRGTMDSGNGASVGFIGGARLTNEAAYVWAKLAKGIVGTDNVDAQLGDGLPAAAVVGLQRATIDEACRRGGTVVVLGVDLKEELPVLYLRVRDAVLNRGVSIIELASTDTAVTALAAVSLRHRPGEVAAAVHALLGGETAGLVESGVLDGDLARARTLLPADDPIVVIAGRPSLAERGEAVAEAVAALLAARPGSGFLPALRRANVHGAIDMGLAPGLLPGRVDLDEGRAWFNEIWPSVPSERGLDAEGILRRAADGQLDTLVLIGADPLADFPDHDLAARGLAGARTVIAVDTFPNASVAQADVVLAAAGFAETDGTTTNIEGRISTVEKKITAPGTARDDWMIAVDLADRLGADLGVESLDDVWAELNRLSPVHAGLSSAQFRRAGPDEGVMVTVRGARPEPATPVPVEAEPPADDANVEQSPAEAAELPADDDRPGPLRYESSAPAELPPVDNYSLRLLAVRKLYDLGTLVQHAPSLAGLAAAAPLRLNTYDADRLGIADGDRVNVSSARGSITAESARDDSIPRGAVAMLISEPDADPRVLIDAATPITDVRVERATS